MRSNRARFGEGAQASTFPSRQFRVPTKGVASKRVEIQVSDSRTKGSLKEEGEASSVDLDRKSSRHSEAKKDSGVGLIRRLSLSDKSKAFAQPSTAARFGSQLSWIPLDVNKPEVRFSAGGSVTDVSCWKREPADPAGVVLDLSDRPLVCMSVRGTEAAIGCADHGVYVVDVSSQKLRRNLYGKRCGHVEWVTCVDFLQDGRIISGGMDNMLCLWGTTGVRCINLTGHSASISAVKVIDGKYGISSSYDKTLMLWDLNRPQNGRPVGCLQGHKGAVLEFAVNPEGGIASGSREGEIFLWDGRDGKAVLRCKGAHDGHVTAVECLSDDTENGGDIIFLSGGQDGVLRGWDKRSKGPVHTVALSRSVKGKGAITNVAVTSLSSGGPPIVVAASADKIIRVLDPRSSFRTVHVVDDHSDFIYSLYTCGSLMWSGGGNGTLLVHDLTNGNCLYGLGATYNGATRCVSLVGPRMLVAAGDDGNCIMYSI